MLLDPKSILADGHSGGSWVSLDQIFTSNLEVFFVVCLLSDFLLVLEHIIFRRQDRRFFSYKASLALV